MSNKKILKALLGFCLLCVVLLLMMKYHNFFTQYYLSKKELENLLIGNSAFKQSGEDKTITYKFIYYNDNKFKLNIYQKDQQIGYTDGIYKIYSKNWKGYLKLNFKNKDTAHVPIPLFNPINSNSIYNINKVILGPYKYISNKRNIKIVEYVNDRDIYKRVKYIFT